MKRDGVMYKAFMATVISNGIIGTLDMLVGIFFVFKDEIVALLSPLMPTIIGPIIAWCITLVSEHAQTGAFYFFSHGVVKLFLVWGLWRGKLWAYPVSIAFLSGFTVYQAFTLAQSYSHFVMILMAINLVVIMVIAHEYRTVRTLLKQGVCL